MKKIFITLLSACMLSICVRADEYRDSLQVLLQYSESQTLTAFSTMIVAPKAHELWGQNLTYAFGQFMNSDHRRQMLANIYEPACRERMPKGELMALLQWFRHSAVIAFCGDDKQMRQAMQTEAIVMYIQGNREKLQYVPARAAKGKTVKIQTMSIPKAYRENCLICFEKIGINDVVIDSLMVPAMIKSLGVLTPEEEKLPEARQFVHDFTVELLVGCFYEKLKNTDLQYCINGTEKPYYQHYVDALQYASAQKMLITTEFLGAFASYIYAYYPHLVGTLNQYLSSN